MNKIYLCALLVVLAASNAEHDAGMRRLLSLR